MVAPLLFTAARILSGTRLLGSGGGAALRLTVHGLTEALQDLEKQQKQIRFAAAVALTKTAKEIERRLPAQLEASLDSPTRFTKSGTFVSPATKYTLEAAVGFKPRQSEYLVFQIEGGVRQPKRKALRLPRVVQLDEHGNMPSGLVRQLVARARAGRRATRTQSRRFGVRQEDTLFYGDPGNGRPPGVYARQVLSSQAHRLVPLVVFPAQSAQYQSKFDFYRWARREADSIFPVEFEKAFNTAIRTAR